MANIWDKFNKSIDVESLREDILDASNNNSRREVPYGTYEVKIEKLELGESKSSGNPMVVCWMRILEGEFKNSLIFMNQSVHSNYPLSIANEFIRSLDSNIVQETMDEFNQIDIARGKEPKDRIFNDYVQYGNLLMDIAEEIDGQLEYVVKYGEEKGFKTYEITEVFEVE
ncbi:DUF669 domain-containing protein [Vallitalea guaymasensis]|uniref:DUF669 domain-containing protein n=1 Tax=Vallitalea guaymasensis TaxID=1185412 RepID=UPI000DE3FE0C|nr:DUF669 domain-containing protein [Vallitalea guaymasensis]